MLTAPGNLLLPMCGDDIQDELFLNLSRDGAGAGWPAAPWALLHALSEHWSDLALLQASSSSPVPHDLYCDEIMAL